MILCFEVGFSQTFSEKLSKEFTFEKASASNTLMVANINGFVKVVGYEGESILVEVEKTIKAKTEARLEKGKNELLLGVIDRADTIILYVKGLCTTFMQNTHKKHKQMAGWGYNWDGCSESQWQKDEGFEYTLDFTIKVPYRINIAVNTVNDGDVTVENVRSSVTANNVNGSIRLKSIMGATYANTINGDVDLDYSKNPDKDCRYYTLNGDINANFKKGLGANLSFESFNGDFYTNVSSLESLPVHVEKKNKGQGIAYKVSGNRFKVGNGGVHLDFETFNGNVYLKEM